MRNLSALAAEPKEPTSVRTLSKFRNVGHVLRPPPSIEVSLRSEVFANLIRPNACGLTRRMEQHVPAVASLNANPDASLFKQGNHLIESEVVVGSGPEAA